MSKVIFIRCEVKGCESKSYPVDFVNLERLAKCPICDPDAHTLVKKQKQQAKMVSNKPKRQGGLDAGRVQSLDAGAGALKEAGVNLENGIDGLGVEVDVTPEAQVEVPLTRGLKIPKITKAQAVKQAKGKGKK